MFAIELIVLFCTLYILYRIVTSKRIEIPSSIPRPPALPFFGHLSRFRSTSGEFILSQVPTRNFLFSPDPIYVLTEYCRKYGGMFQLKFGPFFKFIVLSSPENVEPLLTSSKHLDKSNDYKFSYSWLGNGLLTSGGLVWKKHRRIITPTFHFKVLEDFLEVFNSAGDVLVQRIGEEVGRDSFDVQHHLGLFALDCICETAMGISVNAQRNPTSEYVKSVKEICGILVERSISLIQRNDFSYRFTSNYAKERKALKVLHGFTSSVVQKRKKEFLEAKRNVETEDEFGIKRRKAFLDLLMEHSQKEEDPLTDEELRNEVDTFMFTGHDSTAGLLSFAVYCLANNPKVQVTFIITDNLQQVNGIIYRKPHTRSRFLCSATTK